MKETEIRSAIKSAIEQKELEKEKSNQILVRVLNQLHKERKESAK